MLASHHKIGPTRTVPRRSARCAAVQPRAFLDKLFSAAKPAQSSSLARLLETVDATDRGLATTPQQLQQIKQCFEELEAAGKTGKEGNISGTWRLLWTTEKVRHATAAAPFSRPFHSFFSLPPTPQETLFILKNAGLFGTAAGDVFQVIDTAAGTLQNVIEFPPEGAFLVNSSLDWVGDGRTDFKFSGARIKLPKGRSLGLPPVGQGWFKSVYCDGKYRLSRDVRGDYLVVVKDGPPRAFS
jgi:hypothetical protein